MPSSCLAASLADHSIAFFGMGDGSVAQFVLDRTSGAVLSRGHSEGLAQLFKRMQTMFLKMPTHTHTHTRTHTHTHTHTLTQAHTCSRKHTHTHCQHSDWIQAIGRAMTLESMGPLPVSRPFWAIASPSSRTRANKTRQSSKRKQWLLALVAPSMHKPCSTSNSTSNTHASSRHSPSAACTPWSHTFSHRCT